MSQSFSFDEWYDIYCDLLQGRGWTGPIDKDSARIDYDAGYSCEEAARQLLEEQDMDTEGL